MKLPPLPDRHTPMPHRPYRGAVTRANPIFEDGPVAPWHATVKVIPLEGIRGGPHFEVLCAWTGPPPHLHPPSDRAVDASDVYTVTPSDGPDFAKELARRALEDLRAGTVPDLRAHAQQMKERTT